MTKIYKEKRWNEKLQSLGNITDKLGMPIDKRIIETVAALNLLGIKTTQSCEGHLSHGSSYPWVNIGPRYEEKAYNNFIESIRLREKAHKAGKRAASIYKQSRELKNKAEKAMLKEFIKVWPLLEEFYGKRKPNLDTQLTVTDVSPTQGNIRSQGAVFQNIRTQKERKQKLKEYQREMFEFGEFLKQKFLAS